MPKRKTRKKLTKNTDVSAHLIPQIRERKLGREGNWGQTYSGTREIEIDPRQPARRYLNTLIHELYHLYFPDLNEETVTLIADRVEKIIWDKGYRRIQK
jgi:hypothetical protein